MKQPSAEVTAVSTLIGQNLLVVFGSHSFSATLLSVELQKLTGMTNPPEKRVGSDGKGYTPKCLRLVFDAGSLVIVLEDCRLVASRDGFWFLFPTYRLEVHSASANRPE
jgi:hypothetical protein